MLRQMLRGVVCCHAHGLSHRDLKPDNFVIASKDPAAALKLIDFGLSQNSTWSHVPSSYAHMAGAIECSPTTRNAPVAARRVSRTLRLRFSRCVLSPTTFPLVMAYSSNLPFTPHCELQTTLEGTLEHSAPETFPVFDVDGHCIRPRYGQVYMQSYCSLPNEDSSPHARCARIACSLVLGRGMRANCGFASLLSGLCLLPMVAPLHIFRRLTSGPWAPFFTSFLLVSL